MAIHSLPKVTCARWFGLPGSAAAALSLVLLAACGGGGGGSSAPPVPPSITSFAGSPGTVTAGTGANLTAVFANGTGMVTPGSLGITSGKALAITPAATTTYTLTVTNSAGAKVQQTAAVTVVPAPSTPAITAPTYVTAGAAGLTASVPPQTGSTYAWTITGGTITAGADTSQVTFTAGASGMVQLDCMVTNAAGTASVPGAASSAIVPVPATPAVNAPADVGAGQAGYVASIASPQAGTTYAWTVGSAAITVSADTTSVTFTPAASGTVTFSVVATNAAGLASAAGIASSAIVVAPVATITAPAKVTAGVAGVATASVPSQAGMTYAWTVGSGTVTAGAGTNKITFTPAASGTVGLSVTVTNAAATATTGTGSCAIVPAPAITGFTASQPSIGPGGTMTLASSLSGGTGVITPGNIAVPASGPTTIHPSATTTYTLTVSNAADVPVSVTAKVRVVVGTLAVWQGVPNGSGNVNGTGSAARFYGPSSSVYDAAGDLYVADKLNHVIRLITPGGVVTTLAGTLDLPGLANGVGTAASFNSPSGIAVDPTSGSPAGRVYVADTGNNQIRLLTIAGGVATVSTFAGDPGGSALVADGTPGGFNGPQGLTVDTAGNVWVADTASSTIRKITPAGVVSTFAGVAVTVGHADSPVAPATTPPATFNHPVALAVDGTGYVFVADTGNNTVRMITPAGVVSTYAGSWNGGVAGNSDVPTAGFWNPMGIALDAAGWIYVCDTSNQILRVLQPRTSGALPPLRSWTVIGHNTDSDFGDGSGLGSEFSLPPDGAYFNYPTSVALNAAGNTLVISDFNNNCIRLCPVTYNTGDGVGEPMDNGSTSTPAGIAYFHGALFLDTSTAVDHNGTARFDDPTGMALDATGNVYVADATNNSIRMITSAGIVSTFAGVPPGQGNNSGQPGLVNGPAATARFDAPNAVAVDDSTLPTAGTVYVADTGNNLVRSISGGTVSTVDTTAVIPLNTPLGVAVDDSTGNVYVADTFNNRIVEIKNGGPVSVLAGGTYGNLDGSGAGAKFALPFGIAVDNSSLASAGTLYVADTYNNTIRKVTPGGAVTTLAGSGTPGFADGTGTAAMFNRPGSIAVDPGTGNVYVADTYNQVVRMIVPATGAVITLAGTGMTVANTGTGFEAPGGLPGNLAFPFGIAVAPGLTSITDVNSVTYSNPGGSLLISVGDAILATPF